MFDSPSHRRLLINVVFQSYNYKLLLYLDKKQTGLRF